MARTVRRRVAAAAAEVAPVTDGAVLAGCGSSVSDTAASTAAADAATHAPNGVEKLASQVGGNWLMLPADPESLGDAGGALGPLLATFGSLFQKDAFLETMLTPEGGATVKGTGDVNGTPVVFLEDTTGKGALAIQTVGEPYPVQIKGDGPDGSGEITFTDWNAPVSVTAPTDVVDISQLSAMMLPML